MVKASQIDLWVSVVLVMDAKSTLNKAFPNDMANFRRILQKELLNETIRSLAGEVVFAHVLDEFVLELKALTLLLKWRERKGLRWLDRFGWRLKYPKKMTKALSPANVPIMFTYPRGG